MRIEKYARSISNHYCRDSILHFSRVLILRNLSNIPSRWGSNFTYVLDCGIDRHTHFGTSSFGYTRCVKNITSWHHRSSCIANRGHSRIISSSWWHSKKNKSDEERLVQISVISKDCKPRSLIARWINRILKNFSQAPHEKVSGPYHFTGLLKSIAFLQEGHSIWLLRGEDKNFSVNDSKSEGIFRIGSGIFDFAISILSSISNHYEWNRELYYKTEQYRWLQLKI